MTAWGNEPEEDGDVQMFLAFLYLSRAIVIKDTIDTWMREKPKIPYDDRNLPTTSLFIKNFGKKSPP